MTTEKPAAAQRRLRRIEAKVRRFMDAEALWPEDGRLLVAVSGGPDSTALLLILCRLAGRKPLRLTAAYFDHRLRGAAASALEAEAVERLAAACNVALVRGGVDVRGLAKTQHLSLEEAARRARYAFLAAAAAAAGCEAVAVGHTAADQAETVLMHVLRGAGLAGLGGIAPRASWPTGEAAVAVVRPLLTLTRAETEAYCRAAGVQPLDDESNRSAAFLRNRLRDDLLPQLRRFNPRADAALVRLADAARADLAVVEAAARQVERRRDESGVAISREALAACAPALRIHALRLALRDLLGDLRGIGERHLRGLDGLALHGSSGDRLDLPRGVGASLTRDVLTLRLGPPPRPASLPAGAVPLSVPGEATFGLLRLRAAEDSLANAAAAVAVDAAAVVPGMEVRRRRPGDRLQPLGMAGTKKLQDLFVDAHVPREERAALPLFVNARGIVWVGGLRLADWAQPRPGRATLTLSYASSECLPDPLEEP